MARCRAAGFNAWPHGCLPTWASQPWTSTRSTKVAAHVADLDLAIPELRIGVECQSWKWHATPDAQRRDAARKRALRRLGWDIIDLWWSDLDRIDDVHATLLVMISERQANQL